MSFSKVLKQNNISLWNQTHVDHPFLSAIQDGSLQFEKFKFYMIQDYKFLVEYCRVISIAISKSFDQQLMSFWTKLLDETLNSEMSLHESFCSDFGISKDELKNAKTCISTKSYCNYLLSTAHKYSIEYISCSLLPCQWGYDEIGRRLGENNKTLQNSFHRRWINAYNSTEYQEITNWLINYVDSIQQNTDNRLANQIFQESLQYELLFWQSSWDIK